MKTTVACLIAVLSLSTTLSRAQNQFSVESQSEDISNNLDLQAVASIFGEATDLRDFEMRLNDYDSQISNLDLNNDGEVDYLRVIETSEDNVHLVVIQAVLDKDVFQDVATIVVEKDNSNKTYIQVIGDPYMYGDNYIIEPVYGFTPSIFSFFWSRNYVSWNSPYYWGYYPSYYRDRRPYELNMYLSNINRHINSSYGYRYTDTRRRNNYTERLESSVSRNDYSRRHPDRTFTSRNSNVRNKQAIQVNRSNGAVRNGATRNTTIQRSTTLERPVRTYNGTRSYQNSTRVAQPNSPYRTTRPTEMNRTSNGRTVAPSNSGVNREQPQPRPSVNREQQQRPMINREQPQPQQPQQRPTINREQPRQQQPVQQQRPSVTRESSPRPTPQVSQPSRSSESRPAVQKSNESKRSNDNQSDRR